MILGFAGNKRSGKDTAFELLKAHFPPRAITRVAFADAAYELVDKLFPGLPENKEEYTDKYIGNDGLPLSRRKAVIHCAESFGRACDRDLWVRECEKRIDQALKYHDIVAVTDVRRVNEAKKLKVKGAIIIALDRKVGDFGNHVSETEQHTDEFKALVDHRLDNNGTVEEFSQMLLAVVQPYVKDFDFT